jgi:catechol 2,3-dioxygenase-like lactoylglutathione lyase family enzyme
MRIELVSVFVENQEKALTFYRDVLGFVPKQDIPMGEFRWLTVVSPDDMDGTELVLEPNENSAAKAYQSSLHVQNIPATAFRVDDVNAEFTRLSHAGVTFSMEPTEMGPTTLAVFDDTCGNRIQIYDGEE